MENEPVVEPVVEPEPEPVVEPEPEPVVEPEPEPVVEPPVEPVVEPEPEPAPEPIDMATTEELLQSLNDIAVWNFALLMVIFCLLFFILIFVSLKAGKD